MKRWQIGLLIVFGAAALLGWKREPVALAFLASKLEKTTVEERVALLSDYVEILAPEGEGPFPVVIQLHGCAGVRAPFQHQWARLANEHGYAAVIVDSNGPRGMDRQTSLERVCAGKTLIGQERAGDIVAALEIAKIDPRLDMSKIVLAGWSHGAWTAMDYMTLDLTKQGPPGFVSWRTNVPEIDGAILFYPYCGVGARARYAPYVQSPSTLALIAGADEVVDASLCIRHFEDRKRAGAPVEMIVYENANHVFDDPYLEAEYQSWFNREYYEDAAERYAAFLDELR